MPLTQFTNTVAMPATNTEYSFGTISPNFDMLDAYVDPGPASGKTRLIWRLYSVIGGVTAKIAELGPVDSNIPYRPFAGIGVDSSGDANSGALFELRAITVDEPVTGVKAGMIGYDMVVNNQPIEVVSATAALVLGSDVSFGTLASYHNRVQVQINPGSAIYASSTWTIYGQITGAAGTIAAVVGEGSIPSSGSLLAPTVVASATRAGASSYVVKARLHDNYYNGATISASTSGSDPKLDGTGGGGGGITELTQDVLAGPGAGSQAASVVEATGELIPGSGGVWGLPDKASSIFFYRAPDGSQTNFVRVPGTIGANPFGGYSFLGADDSRNVTLGSGTFSAGANALTLECPVTYINRGGKLVAKTYRASNNFALGLWWIQQPAMFGNIEPYLGGAAPFTCDAAGFATSFIECRFAVGGGGGTISLAFFGGADPGRVLHIGDGIGTISVGDPLIIQPPAGVSVAGGVAGAPLTITTPGWAQKLVLNSTGDNWMIF